MARAGTEREGEDVPRHPGVVPAVLALVAVAAAGCRAVPAGAPEPPRDVVVPRHWDQVCRTEPRDPTPVRVGELFDTAGLSDRLAGLAPHPFPTAPPWPAFEFISRYDASGRPVASGVWESTLSSDATHALEGELRSRVRPLPRLLEPAGFRSVVTFRRPVTFEISGPVECIPHMVHRPGERPTGLPEDVATWGGRARVREGDTTTAVVRLRVDRAGRLVAVDSLDGSYQAIRRAREVAGRLRFDPALRNGVPVPGALLQVFAPRRPRPPS